MRKNIKAECRLDNVGVLWFRYFGQYSSYKNYNNVSVNVKHYSTGLRIREVGSNLFLSRDADQVV